MSENLVTLHARDRRHRLPALAAEILSEVREAVSREAGADAKLILADRLEGVEIADRDRLEGLLRIEAAKSQQDAAHAQAVAVRAAAEAGRRADIEAETFGVVASMFV